ncbi:MAG TPA: methyltransferase domain-containing protein, partial [Alphaproteobacteria bacterium]|nr:methyltransferase domain-containing protein [Alphaproteobacteria bacterium]
MTDNIFVFDRNLIRRNRNRAATSLPEHGFLIDWSMKQIENRLQDVKRKFPTALQIGCRSDLNFSPSFGIENLYRLDIAENLNPTIHADEELLPFAAESFDLIISPLNLHNTNDLPGVLSQIKYCLKPDGLFIASMLGGETLYELRQIMNKVEMDMSGGIHPRIAPFADMPQMGSLMQRAGFNLPVIDSEKVTVTYDNIFNLMKDLRFMGEGNAMISRSRKFTTREFFARVAAEYAYTFAESDGRIPATFEVIF